MAGDVLLPSTGGAVYVCDSDQSAVWDTVYDDKCFWGWVHYEEEYDSLFFEYRKQMYVIMSTLEKNKSELYMNGYRGFCASNSADLTKTNIYAAGLQTNELADCIIYLNSWTRFTRAQTVAQGCEQHHAWCMRYG